MPFDGNPPPPLPANLGLEAPLVDVVRATRTRISNPAHWRRGGIGHEAGPVCLMGAYYLAIYGALSTEPLAQVPSQLHERAYLAFRDNLVYRGDNVYRTYGSIPTFNDLSTHSVVIQCLDETLERLEAIREVQPLMVVGS